MGRDATIVNQFLSDAPRSETRSTPSALNRDRIS